MNLNTLSFEHMKRAEFYILKYLPVLIYIGFTIPYLPTDSSKLNIDWLIFLDPSILSIVTLVLVTVMVIYDYLNKFNVTQILLVILMPVESAAYLLYTNLYNSFSLIYPLAFYLLFTLIVKNFASGRNDNKNINLITGFFASSLLTYTTYLFYKAETILAVEDLKLEFSLLWFSILLVLLHWRSNLRILTFKEEAIQSTTSQLEMTNKVLSLIGHNIRTPLTNLSLQLQIAQRSEPKNPRYEQLSESVNRLIDITEATIVQNKPMDSDESSTIEFVQEIQNIYRDRIEITVDNNVYFHKQENISQIFLCLQNVLDNAIYWSPNSMPSLEIRICSNTLCITIEDGGRGMSYSAAQNYGSKMGGSLNRMGKGIGMYYSIKLINQIGLNFLMRTRENVGTQVLICNNEKRELEFTSAQGWLHKSFYPNSSGENLIIDKISTTLR